MNIKLLRDLWRQRLQSLAITMIVACGVASQITSFSLISTLRSAMQDYYDAARFPDLFVHLDATPLSQARRLNSISGVNAIQARLVLDGPLQISKDLNDTATATMIAVPAEYEGGINRLVVRQGASLPELSRHQVIVSEVFAEARNLRLGEELQVTILGQRHDVTVAGIAISPEYLFQIREGAGVPDNRRFAVIWMRYADLSEFANLSGLYNDVLLTLNNRVPIEFVKEHVARSFSTRSNLNILERSAQVSHRYTTNAVSQLYAIAIVPPAIFLAVASFLIYIATSRLVRIERESIAMQRAFGYSSFGVGNHYFLYVMIVVLSGCVLGILWGIVLANQAITIYNEIYRFPSLPLCISKWSLAISIVASSLAGVLGGAYSVWSVVSIPPALGLRPEPPASYRLTWYDQLAACFNLRPIPRMVLRGLGRWPLRTMLGVMGIALGIGVMVLGSYTQGAIAYIIDFEFFFTRRYDVMVQFAPNTSIHAIDEVQRLPGVIHSEPFESGRFSIRCGHRYRTVTVMGIPQKNSMLKPVTQDLRPIQLHCHGIAISYSLAEALHADLGTTIELSSLAGERMVKELPTECLVTDYTGLNAYVDLDDFRNWFCQQRSVGGVYLQVDSNYLQTLTDALEQRPNVQAVTIKNAALENFIRNDSKNLLLFRLFNMLFSAVIGVGAVYSIASISLLERQRDLALLRVLGYSAAETGRVLMGELLVMSLLAIPVGCLTGYWFAAIATWMLNSETQRIPLLIQPSAYGSSVLVSLAACLISACVIQRRVNRLDCIAQLNGKD